MEIYQDPFSPSPTDRGFTSDSLYLFDLQLPGYDVVSRLPPGKADLIPVEIFSEIFLYTTHNDPRSQVKLMLVCRRWHAIMLSTPGILSRLRIRGWTRKEDVEIIGRRWLLDVTIEDFLADGNDFDIDNFHASLTAATQATWRSLEFISFGPDCLLYLGQPSHVHVFHSLTTLKVNMAKDTNGPVDILPHLQRLENFNAQHLYLPIYPPDVHLPLTQTLRVLHLKCASIQWLAGQVFPALNDCTIIFPPHTEAFELVDMPLCSSLKYNSNGLGHLGRFSLPSLARLNVKCGQWSTSRGTLQVAALHPMLLTTHSITCIYLQVECSEQLLAYILRLVPNLEKLWLGLARPCALSKAFFQEFVGGPSSRPMTGSPNRTVAPLLCRKLKMLYLHYKRWFRGSEMRGPISALGNIVGPRQLEERSRFSLRLSSDDWPKGQVWKVHEPVKRFDLNLNGGEFYIGFPSPYGIVPLSPASKVNILAFPHFKELEYITAHGNWYLPIEDFFPFHNLGEVRMQYTFLKIQPNTPLPSPFHTLRVLLMYSIPSSLLLGQVFHKLERFLEYSSDNAHDLRQGLLTEMPVCTRLVVELSRLATLKLPEICELSVCFDDDEPNEIWARQVAVNSNLPGLKLLHLHCGVLNFKWPTRANIMRILRSLPALEILVIDDAYITIPYVDFLKAFVPIDAQESTGLNQSSGEHQILKVPCPNLQSLHIEGTNIIEQPAFIPVLKDVVTLRAVFGSPLKSFTIYRDRRKWELIGRDGGFTIEEGVPAIQFVLEI